MTALPLMGIGIYEQMLEERRQGRDSLPLMGIGIFDRDAWQDNGYRLSLPLMGIGILWRAGEAIKVGNNSLPLMGIGIPSFPLSEDLMAPARVFGDDHWNHLPQNGSATRELCAWPPARRGFFAQAHASSIRPATSSCHARGRVADSSARPALPCRV